MASSVSRHELPETAESCMHALWIGQWDGRIPSGAFYSLNSPAPAPSPGGRFSAWPVSLTTYRYGGATTQWALIPWPDYDETVYYFAVLSLILRAKGIGLVFDILKLSSLRGDLCTCSRPRVTMVGSLER